MNTSAGSTGTAGLYDIGVAIVPLGEAIPAATDDRQEPAEGAISGYDDALGMHRHAPGPARIVRGEEAVRVATEAIASQIGVAAQRIAAAIGQQVGSAPSAEGLGLEAVEVTFGVSLAAGVQALFTAQAQSSAQVTVRLSRPPADQPDGS